MGAVVCEDGTAGHALQACEGLDCATPQVELWKTWGMVRFHQCEENLS